MKRLTITIALMIITLVVSAQNYSTWLHHGTYRVNQCYDILELSDGNLVVKEAVFDDNLRDVGYNLYKITPQGELLDSLFVENHDIYWLNPMLRDPYNTNSNIITSFYTSYGMNYYKATCFNDNMEITGETISEYYDNCMIPTEFFVDSNNDLICRSKLDDNNFCFVRMGLDGSMKAQSDTISTAGAESGIQLQHPVFQISSEPLRYGYIMFRNNDITIDVYDEWFTRLERKTIKRLNEWYLGTSVNTNACGTGDGGFVITTDLRRLQGMEVIHGLFVLKFNANIDIEKAYCIAEYTSDYPKYYYLNKNLCVTDNNIFVVWEQKKERQEKLSVQTMFVSCLDKNLNPVWSEPTMSVLDATNFFNNGITSLSNGGVAISGWLASEASYYESKDIYAIVSDNYLSTPEVSTTERPFVCHPNPAKDVISISFAENSGCNSIAIYSIDGRLVKLQNFNSGTIDVSGLSSGVYVMKVRMADGSEFTERIVKE